MYGAHRSAYERMINYNISWDALFKQKHPKMLISHQFLSDSCWLGARQARSFFAELKKGDLARAIGPWEPWPGTRTEAETPGRRGNRPGEVENWELHEARLEVFLVKRSKVILRLTMSVHVVRK